MRFRKNRNEKAVDAQITFSFAKGRVLTFAREPSDANDGPEFFQLDMSTEEARELSAIFTAFADMSEGRKG